MTIDSAEEPLRLFTAISFPPEMLSAFDDLQERLRKGIAFTGAHPIWVGSENAHLTLVFLGGHPAERVADIISAADAAGERSAPFQLRLGGLNLFPNPKEPRTISLALSGDLKELSSMREELANELRTRQFPVEDRPFRPHVTLARIKSMRGVPGLRSLIAGHQPKATGSFEINRITLFKSTLTPEGPIYDILHEAPLKREQS